MVINQSFLAKSGVIILNLVIIVGAVYWSSKGTSLSIYDKYAIELKEVILPVENLAASIDFYTNVLGFKLKEDIKHSSDDTVIIDIPGPMKLRLEARSDASSGPKAVVRFTVSNGIKKIHHFIKGEIGNLLEWQEQWPVDCDSAHAHMPPISVSSLIPGKKIPPVIGMQVYKFFIVDPDGNLLEYSSR